MARRESDTPTEPAKPPMTFGEYVKRIGIADRVGSTEAVPLNNVVAEVFAEPLPEMGEGRVIGLFSYDVPKELNGACMYPKVREGSYNLAATLGLNPDVKWGSDNIATLREDPHASRLWHLKRLTDRLGYETQTEWVGVYRAVTNPQGEHVLVKEAYRGSMSKPEFPLTEENAKKSNNSKVGLTGEAVIMDDVLGALSLDPNATYYACDPNVESEFCLPIFDRKGDIIGIIDAEAWAKNHFTPERLLQIAKAAYDLGQIDMGMAA